MHVLFKSISNFQTLPAAGKQDGLFYELPSILCSLALDNGIENNKGLPFWTVPHLATK